MATDQFTKMLLVRLPADVKTWLEAEAARNLSTQTSEVVRAVRQRMEAEHAAAAR
jgi:macrodomain Ter protein organizer (MatP/YcbG family)